MNRKAGSQLYKLSSFIPSFIIFVFHLICSNCECFRYWKRYCPRSILLYRVQTGND